MSANPPNDATVSPTHEPLDEEALLAGGQPRRSKAAWGGFFLALSLIVPWVAFVTYRLMGQQAISLGALIGLGGGLLAVALGVIGIFRTRKRARRGRGLAIAAIPIGLVAGLLQFGAGIGLYQYIATADLAGKAVTVLASSSDDIPDNARRLLDEFGSPVWKQDVTPEGIEAWLSQVIATHGQLQDYPKITKPPRPEGGHLVVHFNGKFVNGSIPIEIHIGLHGGRNGEFKIDDFLVGGVSPRQ